MEGFKRKNDGFIVEFESIKYSKKIKLVKFIIYDYYARSFINPTFDSWHNRFLNGFKLVSVLITFILYF